MVKKFLISILVGILVVSICGCGSRTAQYVSSEDNKTAGLETGDSGENMSSDSVSEKTELKALKFIYVYVCGAVAAPGVYEIEEGSRICDLFSMAGGLTAEAAEDYWNQARILVDGEMIYVPTKEEAEERTDDEKTVAGSVTGLTDSDNVKTKKININTASKEELMTLPGIGESKALAIIAYRQEKGKFSSVEQLKEISGIKDGVYSKIEDYVVID